MPIVTYTARNGRTARIDVPSDVALDWEQRCYATSRLTPVNDRGYHLRPYAEMNVASHAPYAPAGVYVDHSDPRVEQAAYEMRDRLLRETSGSRQEVLATIAARLGMRHWRDAYNATRNVGRRLTGEDGRNADGDLVWRRWSNRRWSPEALVTATARATAGNTRCFGVELEFNHPDGSYGSTYPFHRAIAAEAAAAGLTFVSRWTNYGRRMDLAGWQGTGDSTVTGGEVISDIMAGDDASLAEVRTMLAIIRDNGGVAAERQGIHVHHDARDFTTADKTRLVDNLHVLAPVLESYLPRSRRSGYWCRSLSDSEWTFERTGVAAGRGGSGSHGLAYNFGHLYGPSPRIEFRAFGHSLNSGKLRVWIRVGQAIMAATKAGIVFGHGTTAHQMVGILRSHGLSASAANRFVTTVDNRNGRAAA
jgi:hypothetical protein